MYHNQTPYSRDTSSSTPRLGLPCSAHTRAFHSSLHHPGTFCIIFILHCLLPRMVTIALAFLDIASRNAPCFYKQEDSSIVQDIFRIPFAWLHSFASVAPPIAVGRRLLQIVYTCPSYIISPLTKLLWCACHVCSWHLKARGINSSAFSEVSTRIVFVAVRRRSTTKVQFYSSTTAGVCDADYVMYYVPHVLTFRSNLSP